MMTTESGLKSKGEQDLFLRHLYIKHKLDKDNLTWKPYSLFKCLWLVWFLPLNTVHTVYMLWWRSTQFLYLRKSRSEKVKPPPTRQLMEKPTQSQSSDKVPKQKLIDL